MNTQSSGKWFWWTQQKQINVQKSETLHWVVFNWILVFEAEGKLEKKPTQGFK